MRRLGGSSHRPQGKKKSWTAVDGAEGSVGLGFPTRIAGRNDIGWDGTIGRLAVLPIEDLQILS